MLPSLIILALTPVVPVTALIADIRPCKELLVESIEIALPLTVTVPVPKMLVELEAYPTLLISFCT